ncbi:hypothetical protein ElyMa_004539700 [Elysia marginata]|uniref:Uncharacterized protein n=1 Tax=Elysia marginata TaxID=1093978 RepID=A0AAV4HQM4_9GAST|nr:hypothetical protein ElyMa_004539700 [Elysia marginata]
MKGFRHLKCGHSIALEEYAGKKMSIEVLEGSFSTCVLATQCVTRLYVNQCLRGTLRSREIEGDSQDSGLMVLRGEWVDRNGMQYSSLSYCVRNLASHFKSTSEEVTPDDDDRPQGWNRYRHLNKNWKRKINRHTTAKDLEHAPKITNRLYSNVKSFLPCVFMKLLEDHTRGNRESPNLY